MVKTGKTKVYGQDESSGDFVHKIDFLDYNNCGEGYKLVIDLSYVVPEYNEELDVDLNVLGESLPFKIENNIYSKLKYDVSKYDVSKYFLYNRAGMKISSNFTDGRKDLARVAVYSRDILNSDVDEWYKDSYTLDVNGGWLDDGGDCKHVVTNAITTWTLQNAYERALNNCEDTTAATLDLAATAAQGSRIWRQYDEGFSNKCLQAAKKAWKAAIKYPDIDVSQLADKKDRIYSDDDVKDEFYWAACELYAATGDAEYLDCMKSSKYYLDMPKARYKVSNGSFNWKNVNALGTLSLIASKNNLSDEDISIAKANVTKSANKLVEISNKEGYKIPLSPMDYISGSNAQLANNIIILSYANEINNYNTTKYLDVANKSMDYLLGNNANRKCYISGYGTNPVLNVSNPFWNHEINPKGPTAPAGVLVGGANYKLEDEYIRSTGWADMERPAAKCYIDSYHSTSTNGSGIIFNAPLTWAAAYLDNHNLNYSSR